MVLGIKGVSWRSCIPPVIAPKPDLVALTGGYRRVPVLQIGADIYCDSQLIVRVLDGMFPDPPLRAAGEGALAFMLAPWFEALQIKTIVPLLFRDGRILDPAFARDRELLMERPFVDAAAWRIAAPHAEDSLRAQLGWLDAVLADGRPWLGGGQPGLLDALAFPNIAFFETMAGEIMAAKGLTHLTAWKRRAYNLGEGDRREISASDAVDEAARSEPGLGKRDRRRRGSFVRVERYGYYPCERLWQGSDKRSVDWVIITKRIDHPAGSACWQNRGTLPASRFRSH